ncbi:MAG TPA: hypothetical protein PK289_09465 [Bacteroidia bacterium]|nr:hypothetical protein [Bacteroidia bacterium]
MSENLNYEHEIALKELALPYEKLPLNIKGSINRFKQKQAKAVATDGAAMRDLKLTSAVIADEILTFFTKDYPDVAPKEFTEEEKEDLIADYNRRRALRKKDN